ncbi:MAG: phosphoglycerate kinase [Alphaproteobacteria bacterium]|nr:phosphoglycerate kinase [Alphaproteobacteria bacterium]
MPHFETLDDLEPAGKRVLIRLDLNLPLQEGKVADLTRLERSLPTLKELALKKAKIIVMAHLGRPKGKDNTYTLVPIAEALKKAMVPIPVFFCEESQGPHVKEAIDRLGEGEVLLLENIRFVKGEEENDPAFAKEMATWADIYVNDAFSAAHRAHVSTEAIAHLLPSFAGRLMEQELKTLERVLEYPEAPMMAIVGGAKVSTKLPLLRNLLPKVDFLVIGGAMANTFLAAKGYDVGASLYEPDLMEASLKLMKGEKVLLPVDVVVADSLDDPKNHYNRDLSAIGQAEKIFDIGPATIAYVLKTMKRCHTLLWNGPLGVFEVPPFDYGTNAVAQGVTRLTAEGTLLSIAGGGDTVAALNHAGVLNDFSYVSTAGGAFLEWLEGKPLPGVKALEDMA